MSSVCGTLDFKDADFDISTSSSISNGSKHSSHAGSEESQESDGDETGFIHQTENEDSVTKDLGKSTLESLPSDDDDKDENVNIVSYLSILSFFVTTIYSYSQWPIGVVPCYLLYARLLSL